MCMQMNAGFKKEQNGTLFCLVGALEGGGLGVGGPSGVSTPKSIHVVKKLKTPSWYHDKILIVWKPLQYSYQWRHHLGYGHLKVKEDKIWENCSEV